MNKKIKKIYTIFFFLCLITGFSKASLLWGINYGIDLYRSNNFKLAKDYFIEYIKSNPNDKDGYYWLARSYFNLKDEKKANENFEKSYELLMKEKNIEKIDFKLNTSSNLEDYFDMAVMFFESGDLKEAETYADLMLKINEKSPSAYFIKAKIAQLEGDNQKAVEYINKAIIFNNKLIKTNLAKSLNIKQLPEMTLEMYEVFALEAYFSNDIASAIRYCRKYLNIKSDNVDILNMLVDLYIKNNDLGLAQILLDENQDIANIYTLLYQAKIYEIKNDEKLESILLSAYKINPNNQNVLLELGNFYLKKGDYFITTNLNRLGRNWDEIKKEWYNMETNHINRIILDNENLSVELPNEEKQEISLSRKFIQDISFSAVLYSACQKIQEVSETTKDGLKKAAAKGHFPGRPAGKNSNIETFIKILKLQIEDGLTSDEAIKKVKMPRNTYFVWLRKYKNDYKVNTIQEVYNILKAKI